MAIARHRKIDGFRVVLSIDTDPEDPASVARAAVRELRLSAQYMAYEAARSNNDLYLLGEYRGRAFRRLREILDRLTVPRSVWLDRHCEISESRADEILYRYARASGPAFVTLGGDLVIDRRGEAFASRRADGSWSVEIVDRLGQCTADGSIPIASLSGEDKIAADAEAVRVRFFALPWGRRREIAKDRAASDFQFAMIEAAISLIDGEPIDAIVGKMAMEKERREQC